MKNSNLISLEIIDTIRQIDLKSSVLYLHSFHTAALVLDLATNLGLLTTEKNKQFWYLAALLHDIGKLDIPSHILLKPGKLTASEMVVMQQHSTFSFERLLAIEPFVKFARAAYEHHEKNDGSGYPQKLRGHEMCVEARLLSLADRFEACTSSGREYRPAALPLAQVFHMLSPDIRAFFPGKYGIIVNTMLDYHREHRIHADAWGEDRVALDLYTSLPRVVNS